MSYDPYLSPPPRKLSKQEQLAIKGATGLARWFRIVVCVAAVLLCVLCIRVISKSSGADVVLVLIFYGIPVVYGVLLIGCVILAFVLRSINPLIRKRDVFPWAFIVPLLSAIAAFLILLKFKFYAGGGGC